MAFKARKLHVLFVDDDAALLDATSRMLTRLGHAVTCRGDSLSGLRIFSEQPDSFDVAIVDANMAVITGVELGQRFRRIQPGMPVILYGGDIDSALKSEAEQAGLSYFRKPGTTRELEAAIGKAIRRQIT